MSLFDFYKAKKNPITSSQSKSVLGPPVDYGRGVYNFNSSGHDNKLEELKTFHAVYKHNPWIHKAVNTIASAASKEYRLVPADPDAKLDESAVAPIEAFLNQPNPNDSCESLIFKITRDLVIYGVCFIEFTASNIDTEVIKSAVAKALTPFSQIITNYDQEVQDVAGAIAQDGLPSFMRVLPACTVEVVANEQGQIYQYIQRTDLGQKIIFQPNQIIHILHPHATDSTYGDSCLEPLVTTATIDNLINQRQKMMLQGDSSIDTLFVINDATDEQVTKFHEAMLTQYKSAGAKARFLTVGNQMEYQDVSKTRDGDFLQLSEKLKECICTTLGVPLSVMGLDVGTAMNGAGSDTNLRVFIEQTVRPIVSHIEAVFNRFVLSRYQSIGLDYLLECIIDDSDDSAELETQWDMTIKNGTRTIDEVRELRGQEPLPDGLGAVPLLGIMGATTVEALINPPEPPAPIIMQHPGAPGNVPGQKNDPEAAEGDKTPPEPKKPLKKALLQDLLREIKKAQEEDGHS